MRRSWLVPLIVGILSVAAGLAVLATRWTVAQLAVFAAFIFIFRGVTTAINAVEGRAPHWLGVLAGVAGVLAGVWLLAWPGPSLLVLGVFIGAWLTVSGVFNAVGAISARREIRHWGLVLAIGIIEVLLGMWAMRRPAFSLGLAITVLGFWAIITGALYIAAALELRSLVNGVVDLTAPYGADRNGHASRGGSPVFLLERLHREGLLADTEMALLLAAVADVPAR
ncbi:MAG: DUF308 domain-containing protein [Frankiaceae bacterium]|nr:DUF308 domain-containing protein [Frankiaceae bacterium]